MIERDILLAVGEVIIDRRSVHRNDIIPAHGNQTKKSRARRTTHLQSTEGSSIASRT